MAHDEDSFTFEEQAEAEALDHQIDERLRALPFLPPDQRGASDPLLIQKLARFYQPQAEEIQSRLHRARERVEQRVAHPLTQHQRKQTPLARLRPLRERQDRMNNRWSLFRAAQGSSRLGALAAALLLAVLVGGLVTGLILVRTQGSSTAHPTQPTSTLAPGATHTPTKPSPSQTPARVPEALLTLQMFTTSLGWATSQYNNVLRTTDGANHWQDVTPSTIDPEIDPGNLLCHFLSPSMGWVATTGSSGKTKLFWTADSGQTWTVTMLPEAAHQITFVNSEDGWFIGQQGGASTAGDAVDLFRTTDGGATWTKVANPDSSTALYSSFGVGIGALGASTAWVTGRSPTSGSPWLYVTHDGGATWQPQTLSLPANAPTGLSVETEPPTFFNAQDGILPAQFDSTALSPLMYVYVTHDGGATWQSTSIVNADYATGPGLDFLNVNQGWASFASFIYTTSDGGRHWTQLPRSSALTQLAGMSFVSNEIGWAIDLGDSGAHLFKTLDGGKTWTVVPFPNS
jgi:photosystem II stability/assembly factor-like uncharacterized protein